MGRPPSDLDDYLDWQQRLESQKTSGLNIDDFCAREQISRSTFYRWVRRLQDGIPDSDMKKARRRRKRRSRRPDRTSCPFR